MEKQVKSKERIADHGEVFTADREVQAMCDLVQQETKRIDSRFLEPACGDGNFPAEILKRKLAAVRKQYRCSVWEWERHSLQALGSIYGVDIMADNCAVCRERLFILWEKEYSSVCKKECRDELRAAARFILSRNIVCGNALTLRCVDGDCRDTAKPIEFPQWIFSAWEDCSSEANSVAWLQKAESVGLSEIKFDVIISNPPYQIKVNEAGKGLGAVPIYQKFVEQAQRLKPKFISMIIPARWFSGGVGLDAFRKNMLTNQHIKKIVDYIDSKECFPGVDVNGGICYFLMDESYSGKCEYVNISGGKESRAIRDLSEFDIFIRHNEALSIIRKVVKKHEKTLSAPGGCSPQTPYGLLSTYAGNRERKEINDCELLTSRGWSFAARSEVNKSKETVDLYKPMISKLSCEHAGNPDKMGRYRVFSRMELLKPGQICSQSYLTVCPCKSEQEATNVYRYLRTKFVRFLILQTLSGMNISVRNFKFVPWVNFEEEWTDEKLFARYDISPAEAEYIISIIKDMDVS